MSGTSFLDSLAAKLANLRLDDDDPYAMFDEHCPASGAYPAPTSALLTTDTRRLVSDITAAAHCAKRVELQRALDELFADVAAATARVDAAVALEAQNASRASQLAESAGALSASTWKECAAVESFVVLNLRGIIERGPAAAADKTQQAAGAAAAAATTTRPRVTLFKQWTESEPEVTAGLIKIEAERAEWDKIIARLG